ncbi:unnamed protein product, partial [Larinioides sclopetarius]
MNPGEDLLREVDHLPLSRFLRHSTQNSYFPDIFTD